MTQDSGDQDLNKPDAADSAKASPKARRRIALTLLEDGSLQLKTLRRLLQIHKCDVRQNAENEPLPGEQPPERETAQ